MAAGRAPNVGSRCAPPKAPPVIPMHGRVSARETSVLREHVTARLVVPHGLEGILVLVGARPDRGRAGADLVEVTLEVRKAPPGLVAEDEGENARPAPDGHVDDRVGVADHVATLFEAA